MTEIFHQIYIIEPLWLAAALGAALVLLWGIIARTAQKGTAQKGKTRKKSAGKKDGAYKAVRIASHIFFAFALFIILWKTVLCRSSNTTEVILTPFHSVKLAFYSKEFIRIMLMNVLLFIPFGMMGPFVFERTKHPALITIIAGFLLSVAVEFAQYFFKLGIAETDDVIMNTLGVAIGTLSWKIGGRKR